MNTKETVALPESVLGVSGFGLSARRDVPLGPLTSIGIGGWAREYYEPRTAEELRALLAALARRGARPFVLGAGSNTVFPDGEYAHPVISTRRLDLLRVEGNLIVAECGVPLSRILQVSVKEGLSGFESLVGIPGSVGGAAAMNAGSAEFCFGQRVEEVGALPLDGGAPFRLKGSEICWGYRTTSLRDLVVAWVRIRLERDSPGEVRARLRHHLARKRARQPLGERSAGCVFRNPPGLVAGRLIEMAGLKGFAFGGVRVSERHANFFVNSSGQATAADFRWLLEEVRRRVARSFGVDLEIEVVLA